MPSTLFPNQPKRSLLDNVKNAIGGNPQGMFDQMYNSNPQFRKFADSMKGKTPEQAFSENGLNFEDFKNLG